MHRVAKQINNHLQTAESILLIPHQNPDGDALGCVAAMMQHLRKLDKKHIAFCATNISDKLKYLPHIEYITTDETIWQTERFDTIIVFDSGDLRYAGVAKYIEKLENKPTIINFDHHATNEYYGDYNLVIEGASSTTEILYNFFTYNSIDIDRDIATCLLTGLVTDTDNFTNDGTSHSSLVVAGKLLHRGGNAKLIRNEIFKDKSVQALKLWGAVLGRLEKHEGSDIAHTYISLEDLNTYRVNETEGEGIANFMNNLSESRAGMILKELENGDVKGSFRTTRNDVDVSLWAKALGGGGHKKAAGFTVVGPIEKAQKTVFETIKKIEASQIDS